MALLKDMLKVFGRGEKSQSEHHTVSPTPQPKTPNLPAVLGDTSESSGIPGVFGLFGPRGRNAYSALRRVHADLVVRCEALRLLGREARRLVVACQPYVMAHVDRVDRMTGENLARYRVWREEMRACEPLDLCYDPFLLRMNLLLLIQKSGVTPGKFNAFTRSRSS